MSENKNKFDTNTQADTGEINLNEVTARSLSRRKFLAASAAVGAGAMLMPLGTAFAAKYSGSVVYLSWGGFYQDSQQKAWCDPFAKESGVRVVQAGPMSEAKVRTGVASGSPEFDIADATDIFLYYGSSENLFEKIDYDIVNRDLIPAQFSHENGVGNCVWSYNVCYNTDKFSDGKGPQTWTDVFDVKGFPGKRILRDRVYGMLEVALLADGVAPADLYPLDTKRAFKKLDTIKDDLILWKSASQAQQLMVDGVASCGLLHNGRIFDAVKKGGHLAIGWEQNVQSVDYHVVLKGAANKDNAMALIERSIQADAQATFANLTAYAPVNQAAFEHIDADVAPWLPTEPSNIKKGFVLNADYWRENLKELTDEWTKWKLS